MIRYLAAFALGVSVTAPVAADDFAEVRDKSQFMSLVEGRDLRIGLYNLTLNVLPDGQITGRALGWDITGSWDWQDGYFCREMDWSGMEIDYNCQLVETRGGEVLRFTVDRGAGDSASFKVR
ncbi:dihydrodipicolinate reductase [Tabrizicola sp.]|uniref:dihydrodipicolinate reductase n=1 Tax=Tabrizicola sp. TaxID=2005166 RepID=UPI00286BF24A|nr:dihydrodipicolinate reductase [Tabrizicola sp.]